MSFGVDYSRPHASEWGLVISTTLALAECGENNFTPESVLLITEKSILSSHLICLQRWLSECVPQGPPGTVQTLTCGAVKTFKNRF